MRLSVSTLIITIFLLALSFIFFLHLPVSNAFFGFHQLNGTYILGDQQVWDIPTDFFEFSKESFTANTRGGTSQGRYSIARRAIEFVHSDGRIEAYKLSRTPNTIMLNTVTYVLATDERLAAIEARKAAKKDEAGFIAQSEHKLNWNDAINYCRQQGGKLPLVNGKDAWAWADRDQVDLVDGFGAPGGPWPSDLPDGYHWTGAAHSDRPDYSWIVRAINGNIHISGSVQSNDYRVVCVP
jgi:hypothetical protein